LAFPNVKLHQPGPSLVRLPSRTFGMRPAGSVLLAVCSVRLGSRTNVYRQALLPPVSGGSAYLYVLSCPLGPMLGWVNEEGMTFVQESIC